MPSALSGQNNYYARHHRRQSSMSQSSLPDQLKNSIAAAYSPSRSAVFLPATTYGHISPSRTQSPLYPNSGHIASHIQSDVVGDVLPSGGDPDEYYRHYQSQHVLSEGLRMNQTTTTQSMVENHTPRHFIITSSASPPGRTADGRDEHQSLSATSDSTRAHSDGSGARARKSSVKHLVAQINASSSEELPPLPTNPISQPGSRNISPVLSANQLQTAANRLPSSAVEPSLLDHPFHTPTTMSRSRHGLGLSVDADDEGSHPTSRVPLFGEVLRMGPVSAPGFGIHQFRQRSGSEGSPLMADRAQFRKTLASRDPHGGDAALETLHSPAEPETEDHNGLKHRRVNSDGPAPPTDYALHGGHLLGTSVAQHDSSISAATSYLPTPSQPSNPTRHLSPSASAAEVRRKEVKPEPKTPKRSSPARRRRSPQIQSPGRSRTADGASSAAQNASLQASIIVPPPKISPPLRSSRPRLPVSSASTAASRARMAEKFTSMQKLHDEKRTTSKNRSKPPELSDVDLKARRLRITQALSRSLEGQDLRTTPDIRRRATSSSRTLSSAYSDTSPQDDGPELRGDVPTVMVNMAPVPGSSVAGNTAREPAPAEPRAYTPNALHAMNGTGTSSHGNDDSPTLGRGEDGLSDHPSPIQTDFLFVKLEGEPQSAVTTATVETEGTNFDLEPQSSTYQPRRGLPFRTQTGRAPYHGSTGLRPRSSCDDLSDRADEESVNLVLRDTMYLEDEEAIRTGYRKALETDGLVPRGPDPYRDSRDSWASSATDFPPHEISRMDSSSTAPSDDAAEGHSQGTHPPQPPEPDGDSLRSTMAGDAYTIVNIVLQQYSTNGIVDQQFVDDVYQRILQASPYNGEGLSTNKIEQICLKELQNREVNWRKSIISGRNPSHASDAPLPPTVSSSEFSSGLAPEREIPVPTPDGVSATLSSALFKSHRYKSSLDSVEDWADTSPSVGDWMRFRVADSARQSLQNQTTSSLRHEMTAPDTGLSPEPVHDSVGPSSARVDAQQEDPEMYAGPTVASPSSTPPALPAKDTPFLEQKDFPSATEPPQVPERLASLTQVGPQNPPPSSAAGAVSVSKPSADDPDGPEHRQLKRRRHVIKELVDTEYTYEKDLKVLCDIYKQTAPVALSEDDIRVLFGNIEQIQEFSEQFLTSLKTVAKPAYTMERPDRKKDKTSDNLAGLALQPNSSSSTLASAKVVDNDVLSVDKDRETRVGQAFELAFPRMEKIYADYIRNRHAANQRLEAIQKSVAAREWLKECRDNSSDITNAWNLDALLVKPVQRITKYPLLLRELSEATASDHPDMASLKRAVLEVTEINVRINDVKKHTELVDQVLNRKRKDSDVRLGLSKAFGRRAEKLKQHLGTAEMYEDNEYNEIKINYDNNIVQLMVVGNDCSSYGRAITKWVNKIVEIAVAGEAWVDVGPSNHQEAESKLRHFAMVTRGISTIALPDHLEQLETKVLNPMQSGVDLMNRFKNDQKGLLQKRDKRLIDYAQAKNKKDRGEKIDKKMAERMEQWQALNSEAKQRMLKLIRATAVLVQHCQRNLLEMQMAWLKMVQSKLSNAMGITLEKLDKEDIAKEWQLDFDFQQASALSLSICNGALLAEAVNMLNFQTPSTTLNGDESPRQPSFSSNRRRSMSLHSNSSYIQLPDALSKSSGQQLRPNHDAPGDRNPPHRSSFSSSHDNPLSAAVSSQPRPSDQSSRTGTSRYSAVNGGLSASSTSRLGDRAGTSAPRLSVETPSPYLGSLQPETNQRPQSSSTFVTAAADIPTRARHQSNSSSIFSSAMPMPDSPTVDRRPEVVPESPREPEVLFTAASVYEFNIDRSRREAGFPYLTYVTGEIFDVIGYNGELWLAKNQDDPHGQVGWIWNKHFAKLAE